ncbi:LysM peptidoglycan-binding domain-containing protein [Alicyclobacillus dauci]|uniref:Lytic murein transglycosylase n=1 Tax=Alicyclobacillus dauci TaxID=1475485 RepID=A0ABY6Z4J3_9BACL|nr:LysM peptidoglycan-binding domain-containing protein [Alicyclobacillus dauci]WAH37582.1 lytic murein transglycosylase [Alicyclobacillus dauci]
MNKASLSLLATLGISALSFSPSTVFASTTHMVQSGDTLWGIARSTHTTVQKLRSLNHLHSSLIYKGERLQLPGSGSTKMTVKAVAARKTAPVTSGVPKQLIPVYQAAGRKYHVSWQVLAAIHKLESNFSTSGHLKNAEGATGPMQFMPSTFSKYGVAAPGHRVPSIYNVDDAIYTAAHMLAADHYSSSPKTAIYHYNHSISYENQVMRLAGV